MATKTYTLYGTCKWAKVQPDQLDLNYDKETKAWKIDLYLTPGSLEIFEKSGLQLKLRSDDDGQYIQLKRPEKKIFNDTIEELAPPYVIDAAGENFTGRVGNGSKVAVEVDVYDTRKGKGHTLVGIQVHDLVPYEDTKKAIEEEFPW